MLEPDLEKMSKADLETLAGDMGLSVSGHKAEILEAIQAARDAAAQDSGVQEAPPSTGEGVVCVNCGQPATVETTNTAVDKVYYCDRHGQMSGEPVTSIGR